MLVRFAVEGGWPTASTLAEGAAPLDEGKAITDVHRIRKAGRRPTRLRGPRRFGAAPDPDDEADVVDAALVEENDSSDGEE